MMNIYVGSYGAYNDGILDGTWVNLPCDDVWQIIKDNCVPGAEEFGIFDYECDFMKIEELDDIEELNELAEEVEDLTPEESDIIEVLVADGYSLREAIDLKDDCIHYGNMDMEDIAIEYVNGCVDTSNLGFLENYIDYSALARDMEIDGRYLTSTSGSIIELCF